MTEKIHPMVALFAAAIRYQTVEVIQRKQNPLQITFTTERIIQNQLKIYRKFLQFTKPAHYPKILVFVTKKAYLYETSKAPIHDFSWNLSFA